MEISTTEQEEQPELHDYCLPGMCLIKLHHDALPGRGGPAEGHEDRGPQRVPDHGGHLHAPGSGDAEGHGRRYGGRVQEGEYRSQEEPVREASEACFKCN